MDDPRLARLKKLLKEGAVQFGDFQLSSGGRSDVYVDGRLFTLSAAGAALGAELLWERIAPLEPDAVGGMTLGADPIVGALLAHTGRLGVPLGGFLVRKEPKGHGTRRCVEGPRPAKTRPRVIVVDDTSTTGSSLLAAAKRVREEWDAEVIAAFTIVDRETEATARIEAEGMRYDALVKLSELR